ncbi:hypothetical protein Sgleb_13600 [Streptomyces glebosus]|uniref:Uncharacterized protein n=1 Tax=Streptomyces glebosus TaxID=249580 RepID=A0A640SPA0_9ACTN|nr:hypothetical protein [Streptomyces glebosus]GFE13313.1 hypothetical protein Sgleb_13600 [Streptomyces glebosus]GHG66509.1 hypothetical protein GCM10010513_35720 [Streptomyces glebosus]
MLRCRLLGHRFRFLSEGATMRWYCARGCGAGGAKPYPAAEEARRYARAFDHEDHEDLGRRAPLVGLFPLRLLRALREHRAKRAGTGPGVTPPPR